MEDWGAVIEKVESFCGESGSQETLGLLTKLITLSLDLNVRQSCQTHHIEVLKQLASRHVNRSLELASDCCISQLTIPVFKLLRNLCAEVPTNQTAIGEEGFLTLTIKVVTFLSISEVNKERTADQLLLLKVCIQLIGNCCVNNQLIQDLVWRLCYPDCFRLLTSDVNSDVVNLSCMVLYACLKNSINRQKNLVENQTHENVTRISPGGLIISNVLVSLKTAQNSEWMVLIMELLLLTHDPKTILKALCDNTRRIALLELILAFANAESDESKTDVFSTLMLSHRHVEYFEDAFCSLTSFLISEHLVPLLTEHPQKDVNEIDGGVCAGMLMPILGILCQCSCHVDLLRKMQGKPTLLENSVDLLRALSEIDGSSSSARHISRLSQDQENHTPQSLYGLKRDLVQLIGNLCYKCKQNQDYMNSHVSLLLNQCSIDHSNPCILVISIARLC